MFDFYYSHGGSRRKSFKSKGEVCSIGSARSNDLVLDTKAMAKRHVELRLRPSGIHITDLGSLSGTWVNKERVKEYGPLSDLDEVVVGDVSLVLDGMPVISDHLVNQGDSASSGARSDNNNRSTEQANKEIRQNHYEEEPVVEKPRKGGLFSLFSSKKEPVGSPIDTDDISDNTGTRESSNGAAGAEMVNDQSNAAAQSSLSSQQETVHASSNVQIDEGAVASAAGSMSDGSMARQSGESHTITAANQSQSIAPPLAADVSSAEAAEPEQEPESAYTEEDAELAYWSHIVHDQLLNQMDLRRKDVNRMTDDDLREEASNLIGQIVQSIESQFPDHLDLEQLRVNVLNEAVGLGPLEKFLEDDEVTEIMVNNHAEIFLEKNGKIVRSKNQFSSDATVYAVIERIITPIGRRIDESSPIVDARLKDGSRVNAVIPPLALKGPSITIRKFPKYRMQFSDLVKFGSTNQQMVDFFQVCVESHKNIIVAGGTGSGKTTLLNVLSNFIPDTDRIVTIEDAAELSLAQPNLVSLESRPPNLEGKGDIPIRDLVKNSLRMRPDRIVIGECRGGEAIDMLQAMNTGHDGSLTTIHANTPRDVISRLEVLVLMAGLDLPVTAIREQVASAVHLIVQQTRYPCGSRKISKVTEVVGVESGTVQLQDIFEYKQQGFGPDGKVRGVFQPTGFIPTFYDELRLMGKEMDISCFNNSRASEVA